MRDGPLHGGARRIAIAIAIAAALSSSCALLPAMDDFTSSGGASDASAADDASAAGDASATSDASEASKPPTCVNGRIGGVAAFDATPAGAKATACGVSNALIVDDQVAGLDADDYAGSVLLDGIHVHACVGVEFGAPLKTAVMRLGPSGNACGAACLGSQCGQGHWAEVFAAPSRGGYRFVGELTTGASLGELSIAVPPTTRVVLVCRGGWSQDKDHVVVDAITAACP
jgi:hypothetical protein